MEDFRRRILLADDDDNLRELLQAWLGEEYHVVCVEDGFELLDYFDLSHGKPKLPLPDLIVSDVYMPGKTGIEVLTELRDQQVVCPVVLMSGATDDHTRSLALEKGATVFLRKPVDFPVLVETVRRLVPQRELSTMEQ